METLIKSQANHLAGNPRENGAFHRQNKGARVSFARACSPHYGCGRGSLENHSEISQRYVTWDISPNRLGDHLFLSAFDSPVRKENKTPKTQMHDRRIA